VIALTAIGALSLSSTTPLPALDGDDQDRTPHFGHISVVAVENEVYDTTFGANSKAPYLSQTLVPKGVPP
jgi:hypothetical protein